MNDKKFTKLGNLIDQDFTIERAGGYQYKLWDNTAKKMLVSDTYQQGYRKIYTIDTDKGTLDLGSGQLSSLLEAVYKNGQSDINGKTFHVKSNGKSGMDIRYFFNPVKDGRDSEAWQQAREKLAPKIEDEEEDPISLEDIPF